MAKKIRDRDTNKKAKQIVDLATGETSENTPTDAIKAAAAALGRKGGLKGGPARAQALSDEEKSAIAKKAAAARWGKKEG
jgi:hypothetical protein